MREDEIAALCARGDNGARRELYERYGAQLMGVCLRYVAQREAAEDVLHDAFLQAFRSIGQFTYRGEGSLRAWLSRVTVNESLGYLRRMKAEMLCEVPISRIEIPEEEECNLPVTQTPAADSETPQVAPKRTLSTSVSDVASEGKETIKTMRRQASKGWSFGVSTGGGLLASSKTMDGYVVQSTTTFSSVQGPVFQSRTESPLGSMDRAVYLANTLAGEEATTEWHHQTPIAWGLSLRKMLSGRMAIESGITYTQLTSTRESGSSRNYNTSEQKLHYVGIPVRVSYQWWNSRRLSVYTSAGGALEKCVDGRLTRSWSLSSIVPGTQPLVQTEKESVRVNALQASVTAAAGIQLNLAPQIGAYVEPGIVYYFDDKSGVETIRKSHPLNLHVEVGLRWIPGEK